MFCGLVFDYEKFKKISIQKLTQMSVFETCISQTIFTKLVSFLQHT